MRASRSAAASSISMYRARDAGPGAGFRGPAAASFRAPPTRSRSSGGSRLGRARRELQLQLITLIRTATHAHECVGHLTRERLDAWRCAGGFLPALLLSVTAEAAARGEGSEPAPRSNDRLITRRALERGWPASAPFEARALLIRTLPNTADKRARLQLSTPLTCRRRRPGCSSAAHPALIVDVPSIDRAHDEAGHRHRIFFGLPPGSVQLALRRAPPPYRAGLHRRRARRRRLPPELQCRRSRMVPSVRCCNRLVTRS